MSKTVFLWGRKGTYTNYAAALHGAGCRVCLSMDLSQATLCDGLLLPGGGDIFGKLDADEHLLIQSFVDTSRPILGICRGMQALNVWFGGMLYDRIPHHQLPQGDMVHPTRTAGCIKTLFGSTPVVNSNHHQAISRLGEGFSPIQWAHDGIIESIGHKSLPIWGVQWHPERQSFALRRRDAIDAAPLFSFFAQQMR